MDILIFLVGFLVGALCVFVPFKVINNNDKEKYLSQDLLIEKMQEQMKLHFENTANKIFSENSGKLSEQNKEKLEEFFKRFKEKNRRF